MYLNIFKRKWITPNLLSILHAQSSSYTIYASTHQCKKIPIELIKGNERWIKSLNVVTGDDSLVVSIDGKMSDWQRANFKSKLIVFIASHPVYENSDELKTQAKDETIEALNIDNDIDHNDHNITYHLNDYSSDERKTLLNYLSNIDGDSIEVSIHMDLSKASKKQLQQHQDNLMLSKIGQ